MLTTFKFVIEIINSQKKKQMGAVKSLTHSYTSNEYLFWYIEKNDSNKIEQLLNDKPYLINQNLSVNFKTTPLHRAASNNQIELVKLFIDKYNADINLQTSVGETALIGAAKRGRVEIVQYLLSKGCSVDTVSKCGLTALDYSVLQGFYDVSLIIYEASSSSGLKEDFEYKDLAKKYKYRYVNYSVFIDTLKRKINPENAPDFFTKQYKRLEDPIVDPRETWKAWILRNMEFKDPPMVERNEVPEELQPQNRSFATFRHTITKWALSPLSQNISLKPRSQTQALSDCKMKQQRAYPDKGGSVMMLVSYSYNFQFQMNTTTDFDAMIDNMKEESELIEANRAQRNRKYQQCMAMYKDFLTEEAELLQGSDAVNSQQKELVSKAFQNTFSRILSSSDVTIRLIKQTYQEKKQFWDNVIKLSANLNDIELKKEFYLQRRNAEENLFEATDHQKDKHKPYHVLMNKTERKEYLREFQQNNKQFEEKVVLGSNTLQQWQNMTGQVKKMQSQQPFQSSSLEGTVINKFMGLPPKSNYDAYGKKPYGDKFQGDSSTSFLNNFTKKY